MKWWLSSGDKPEGPFPAEHVTPVAEVWADGDYAIGLRRGRRSSPRREYLGGIHRFPSVGIVFIDGVQLAPVPRRPAVNVVLAQFTRVDSSGQPSRGQHDG